MAAAQGDMIRQALSIELNVNNLTSPALRQVSNDVGQVEKDLSALASTTMQLVGNQAERINEAMVEVGKSQLIVSQNAATLLPTLTKQSAVEVDINKTIDLEGKTIKDDIAEHWLGILKSLEKKAKLLDEELKTINREREAANALGREMGDWERNTDNADKALKRYTATLAGVYAGLRSAFQATEEFVTANYRAYGSQTELVGRASALSAAYGMLRAETILAYKEIGNVKAPIGELDALAEAAAKINRITGVGVSTIVNWQRSLRLAGSDAGDVTRRTEWMAVAMRTFGLSTQDVNNIMSRSSQSMSTARVLFGAAAADITKANTMLAAMGKEAALSSAEIDALVSSMNNWNPGVMGARAQLAGMAIKTPTDNMQAMILAADALRKQYDITGETIEAKIPTLEALGGVLGMDGDKMASLILVIENFEKKGVAVADIYRHMTAEMTKAAEAQGGLNELYNEANNTLPRQLDILNNQFTNLWTQVATLVGPVLITLFQIINTVAMAIVQAITAFNGWLDTLGPLGTGIRWLLVGLLLLPLAIYVVIGGLGMFGRIAVWVATTAGTAVQRFLESLGRGLTAVAGQAPTMLALAALFASVGLAAYLFALAVAQVASAGWAAAPAMIGLAAAILIIGQVLNVMARSIRGAEIQLLVIGVVLVATAYAALLFAQAVAVVAALGPEATRAIFGLTAALAVLLGLIFAFTIALVAVGTAGVVAVPVLLGIAAILAGVALVMLAAAAATWIFAQAVVLISGVGTSAIASALALAAALLILTVAVAALGAVATFTAPGLLALAALVVAVGLAAYLFAHGLKIIGETSADAIKGILLLGPALVVFAASMAAASLLALIAAPGLLALGAGLLLIGVGAILVARALQMMSQAGNDAIANLTALAIVILGLVAALAVIGAVATLTAPGLLALGVAFIGVGLGAYLFARAVSILKDSGEQAIPILIALGVVMIAVAIGLAVAGYIALAAAPGLLALAVVLLAIGVSALLFAYAVKILAGALDQLTLGSVAMLIPIALVLALVGVILGAVAKPLMLGALGVFVAAGLLWLSSLMLAPAAQALDQAGPQLLKFGALMFLASAEMLVGGALLVAASVVLIVAGIALWLATFFLGSGVEALLPIGQNLEIIGKGFETAGKGLTEGLANIRAGIGELRTMDSEIKTTAKQLKPAFAELLEAATDAQQAAVGLWRFGTALWPVSVMLASGAAALRAGADRLGPAAVELSGTVTLLNTTAADAVAAAEQLQTGSAGLTVAAAALRDTGLEITEAGAHLYYGARLVRAGIADLAGMGAEVTAASFALRFAAVALDEPAWSLARSGQNILVAGLMAQRGMGLFVEASGQLGVIVTNLSGSLSAFDAAEEALAKFAGAADLYGARIDRAIFRIALTISRAIPWLERFKSLANLSGGDRAQANTVVAVQSQDFAARVDENEYRSKHLESQRNLVAKLDEILTAVAAAVGGGENMNELLSLLKTYLPNLGKENKGGAALHSRFSNWNR